MFVHEFIKLVFNEHYNNYIDNSRKVKKWEVSQVLWKRQTLWSYCLVDYFFIEQMVTSGTHKNTT